MTTRAQRSDAVANRARIVELARDELSASNGGTTELRLHRIAKAAGVGQGTLYRHFPTKEHLIAEVYRVELEQLVDAVPSLLAENSPTEALVLWLEQLVEYTRVKRGVMAAVEASTWTKLHSDQGHLLGDALDLLLERGRAAKELRPDVDAGDVVLFLGALARIPQDEWDKRSATLIAVLMAGLRAS